MKTTSLKAEMEAAFRELPTTYEELCRLYLPRKIHDKAECQRATAVVDALSIREGLNKDQLDYLELVGDLVNEYEKHHVAQPENSSPVEVLRYLMEENRISTRQMSRILGKDESIVSKILKGERSITIEHARKFGHHFGVNPGLFLRLSDEMTVDFRRCLPLACRKHANQKW
jgi:HTH-type transcriptional regulator/antitoxin HigA